MLSGVRDDGAGGQGVCRGGAARGFFCRAGRNGRIVRAFTASSDSRGRRDDPAVRDSDSGRPAFSGRKRRGADAGRRF